MRKIGDGLAVRPFRRCITRRSNALPRSLLAVLSTGTFATARPTIGVDTALPSVALLRAGGALATDCVGRAAKWRTNRKQATRIEGPAAQDAVEPP